MVSVCVIWFLFGLLQESPWGHALPATPSHANVHNKRTAWRLQVPRAPPFPWSSHFWQPTLRPRFYERSSEPGARAWPKIPWDFLALRHPHNTHGLGTRKKGTRLQHGIVQNSSNPKWLSWYGHTVIYGESSKVGEKHAHWNAPKLGSQLSFAQVLVTIGQDLEVYPMILLGPDSFGRILHICRYLILHWHKPSLTGLTRHCGSPPWDWTSTHLELWDETWQTSGPGREPLEFGGWDVCQKMPMECPSTCIVYVFMCYKRWITKYPEHKMNIWNVHFIVVFPIPWSLLWLSVILSCYK